MAAIPPNNNLEGLIGSLKDGIYGAYNKGVKYGRYLALQEYLERKESAQPKWTSVEEDLPAHVITPCLICADGYVQVADWSHDKYGLAWWFFVDGEYETCVTHWMPLPEPPREVK